MANTALQLPQLACTDGIQYCLNNSRQFTEAGIKEGQTEQEGVSFPFLSLLFMNGCIWSCLIGNKQKDFSLHCLNKTLLSFFPLQILINFLFQIK